MGTGEAYASAVGAIALVAEGAFADDAAVGVGGFVRGDVAGAAAAVGDDGVGHEQCIQCTMRNVRRACC